MSLHIIFRFPQSAGSIAIRVKNIGDPFLENRGFFVEVFNPHVFQHILATNGLTQRSFIIVQSDGSTVNDVDIFDGPLGEDVEYRIVEDLKVV